MRRPWSFDRNTRQVSKSQIHMLQESSIEKKSVYGALWKTWSLFESKRRNFIKVKGDENDGSSNCYISSKNILCKFLVSEWRWILWRRRRRGRSKFSNWIASRLKILRLFCQTNTTKERRRPSWIAYEFQNWWNNCEKWWFIKWWKPKWLWY